MDEEKKEQVDLYTVHYIQKQEQLLLDFMRKNIDAEVRIIALNNTINEANARYEESQRQVEIGNEMLRQAAVSIETLTVERDKLHEELEKVKSDRSSLQNNYTALQQKNQEIISEKDKIVKETQGEMQLKLNDAGIRIKQLEEELALCNSRSAELNSEYRNQVDQLNTLYVENQKLKGEEETKKPKKKETPATLPDEF
jgi:chromosome segregation ATPase